MGDAEQAGVLSRSRARWARELGGEPADAGEQNGETARTSLQSCEAQSRDEAAEQLPRNLQEAARQLPQNHIDLRSRVCAAVEAVEQRPRVITRNRELAEQ